MQECFKGDKASQIRPLSTPKPLNRFSQKKGRRHYVLGATCHAKFCSDRFTGLCSPNTWFCRAFGVTSFCVFGGSSIRLQPTPLNGFFTYNTSQNVVPGKEMPFGGHDDYILYLDPYIPEKSHFGERFWPTFFVAKNRFNIRMLQYKLPLIVYVAP